MKQYKCPYCDFRNETEKLIDHINDEHSELIPEHYTAARLVYNIRNKRDHGTCLMCKKPTEWNESKGRYYSLCDDKKCHDDYVKRFEKNMIRVYDKTRLLDDMEQQEKMLANRKISGTYKFQDGGVHTYTGSFEHKALEFLDKVMQVKSKELMVPGPILEYKDSAGKKRKYIPDIYWIDLNLLIEVKDGGSNPNKKNMEVYRDKQEAKEKMVTDCGEFNYLRLTNNNFEQLFTIVAEIKKNNLEGKTNRVIRINEAYSLEVGPVGGMPPNFTSSGYLIDKGFNGVDTTPDDDNARGDFRSAITNDLGSDKAIERTKDGKMKSIPLKEILNGDVKVYRYLGTKEKFLEIAKQDRLDISLYEALSGHRKYSEDQIDFDPLFERFSLSKEKSKSANYIATLQEEYNTLLGKVSTALPILNKEILTKVESKLEGYRNININEDINGYFAYNTITKVRTPSYKNLDDLKLEDSNLEDKEAEKWERDNMRTLIGDEYDPDKLEMKKQQFYDMPKKARRESDWKSFDLYHFTNQEMYDNKKSKILERDLKRQVVDNYDGISPMCEETYNFENVKYGQDAVDKAKDWAVTAMRHIIVPREKLEDLEYDWVQFKSQHRKLQRESDWKSQELFGMNNETHYNYLKSKLVKSDIKTDNNTTYDGISSSSTKPMTGGLLDTNIVGESAALTILGERTNKVADIMSTHNLPILFSDNDIIYNGNEFRSKKVNVLLITGMSGGGKTTLAYKLSKSTKAHVIQLDWFSIWEQYKENPDEFLEAGAFSEELDKYLSRTYKDLDDYKRKIGLVDKNNKRYYAEMLKMVEYFIKISNPSNRYIFEGVQVPIITLLNTSILNDTATVLVNTSVFTSFLRRLNRDEIKLSDIKNLIIKYYDWYQSQNNFRGLINGFYMNSKIKNSSSNSMSSLKEDALPQLDKKIITNNLMPSTFEHLTDLPSFTPDELNTFGSNNGEVGFTLYEELKKWKEEYKKLFETGKASKEFIEENRKRIQKLSSAITDEEKLKLGWNPAIPFTPENRDKIDTRIKKKISHAIINEVKEFPVKIGQDYSIYIKQFKKIKPERAYSDCHDLMMQYDKAENYKGLEYEIVKMYWIKENVESMMDELMQSNKGGSSEYKKLMNLRARVINDYKKYIAIILKHNSKYNFRKHYESSPFSDSVYKIDGSIVKLTKSIKDFLF